MKMEYLWIVISLFSVALTPTFATRKASCNGWTLTAPEEGDFSCNPPGAVISSPGTRCTLNCNTGYSAKHEVLVCSEKGGWVPTNSPECQVDSTMTLVIVLSIVASIMVIFGLSVLYAKTSKKCRGRRRRLDDDDPEVANKRAQDTSTYYDQVKVLQRKRRLHAKRQSRSIDSKKRKRSGLEEKKKRSEVGKQKRDRKRASISIGPDKKRSKRSTRSSSKQHGVKTSTKDLKEKKKDPIREKPRNLTNDSRNKPKQKDKFENRPSRVTSQNRRKNDMLQNLRTILFCIPFRKRLRERFKPERRGLSTSNLGVEKTKKRRNPPTTVATSRASSSSFSSNAPSTKICAAVNSTQAAAKTSETSQKPPRPPPPKFSTLTSRVRNGSANDSDNDENHKTAMSSGYSSEGGKLKKHAAKDRQSKAGEREDEEETVTSDRPNKRIEMMSYDLTASAKEDSNPYDHYPVAQSYRQYLDFENDYRRTTGDYHPQYDNIQVIPIQTAKRKKKVTEAVAATEKTPEAKRSSQGGMKYIDIGTKENEDNDAPSKTHMKKNHRERYENPSARDKRTTKEDRNNKDKMKRSKNQTKAERKSKKLSETKRAIADETIIVNGTTANDATATTLPKLQKNNQAPVIEQSKTAAKKSKKAKK